MSRHVMIVGVLWVFFTALALAGAAAMNPFPTVGAEEAEFSDHAFRIMTFMGAPVFGFVIAALVYNIARFRSSGQPSEDGPPFKGGGMIPRAWLGVTTALAVVVMIYPGLTGLAEMRSDRSYDLEVNVTGYRWSWSAQYPDGEFTSNEIVLPKDQRVRFNVTAPAGDVLHSFWVPAFRLKIDALPGRTTFFSVEPTITGSFDDDDAFRVQCAELCGVDHSLMMFPIRVVEPSEFESWLANLQEGN